MIHAQNDLSLNERARKNNTETPRNPERFNKIHRNPRNTLYTGIYKTINNNLHLAKNESANQ